MPRTETRRTGGFFKGVLDGFRSSVSQPLKAESEVEESLRPEHFHVTKTVRHGFPFQPTAIGFDPVQRLLAIATKNGSLRLFGRPGVDVCVQHVLDSAVIQIIFLINEGAMITVCSDDSLHLWNIRQKRPEIVHTLKFQKERITYCYLPFHSKWLYIGTERGNVHVVNIESFVLSGYVINWNKAIELSRKSHPGSVVHLSDNPVDSNKLFIGYETGIIVMWDLRTRTADGRYQCTEPLKSITWHHEGKQFMCSHNDGSLTTWNVKAPSKPHSVMYPHAKMSKEGKPEMCRPITKVEWKTARGSDSFVAFSGGMPYDKNEQNPCLTVIHGKTTTVLEMEHSIIDFITLCETPWQSDFQDPYAIVVLLYNDLVVVDLTSSGYPCYQNPYPMDLHESPVTFCSYLADCPADLIPAFYSVGSKGNKRQGFSEKEWPINGGEWGTSTVSYPEIIITGHADGSMKFWDASSVSLQILYKLKTSKIFERPKARSFDSQEEDPFAIEHVAFCPESRLLCAAGSSSHVMVFKFKKTESVSEVSVLEIPIVYEIDDDPECSPDSDYPPQRQHSRTSEGLPSSASEDSTKKTSDYYVPLKVKSGLLKKVPGFQVELVCLTPIVNGESSSHITALSVNSSIGLMAYGNDCGLAVVDIIQKYCIVSMGTPDLYGSADPYQRIPRSPKRNAVILGENSCNEQDRCRSPTTDQPDCYSSTDTFRTHHYQPFNNSDSASCIPPSPSESLVHSRELPVPLKPPRRKKKTRITAEQAEEVFENGKSIEADDLVMWATSADSAVSLSESVPSSSKLEKSNSQASVTTVGSAESSKSSRTKLSNDLKEETHQEIINTKGKGDQEAIEASSFKCMSSTSKRSTLCKLKSHSSQGSGEGLDPELLKRKKSRKQKINGICLSPTTGKQQQLQRKPLAAEMRRTKSQGTRKMQKMASMASADESTLSSGSDKIDSSFSRSRSSSMSSLENISSEAIQCLSFADSYSRKSDFVTSPTLWVGTSLGSILVILLTLPPTADFRQTQPVIVTPSGTIFRLKGSILSISFLDCTGALVPYQFEYWKDESRDITEREKERDDKRIRVPSNNQAKNKVSPTSSSDLRDSQFVVMCSEKQARIVSLPSQTCIYKSNLTETSFVVTAEVVSIKGTDSVCLACYVATGNIAIFSLPSLKLLHDVDFLPLIDMRIARTFCFSNNGHGTYMCSPSELQKFTISATFCENLQDMLGTLFLSKEVPEAPKFSFFKGLFGGGTSLLDREELFGESSGKPSKSIARHIPGNTMIEQVKGQSSTVAGELAKVRQGLAERGENLSQLEERTEKMMSEAESFHTAAHQLTLKYRDKKWYQF